MPLCCLMPHMWVLCVGLNLSLVWTYTLILAFTINVFEEREGRAVFCLLFVCFVKKKKKNNQWPHWCTFLIRELHKNGQSHERFLFFSHEFVHNACVYKVLKITFVLPYGYFYLWHIFLPNCYFYWGVWFFYCLLECEEVALKIVLVADVV